MMPCVMRTTLTIDDDLAGILQRRARELGRPFKDIVNSALRQGLFENVKSAPSAVGTRPYDFGGSPGIDLDRLNQLADELEAEDYQRKALKDDSAGH